MCKNCAYVTRDGKKLICMCNESENQYDYVSEDYVCDEYEPKYQHQEHPNEDYFECLNDYLDGTMNV